jgi:POT family proton-dependent oligopeptide transporter
MTSQDNKDRLCLLLLCFIMVIILGCLEQAGGLMNLYTDTKTDRMLLWEISPLCFKVAGLLYPLQLV